MVSSGRTDLEYSTYISGSPSDLNETKNIAVCNSKVSELNNLSINTMVDDYSNLDSSQVQLINREDNKFLYKSGQLSEGFDVVFYLKNNVPVGYTKYKKAQGKINNVTIMLNFKIVVEPTENIKIENSLGELKTSDLKNLIGQENYKYTSKKTVLNNLNNSKYNFRYTNHLDKIEKEGNLKTCVNQTTKFTIKENNELKQIDLGITKNTLLDEKKVGFVNHQVGYLNSDLAIYSWVDNKFYIRSLITTNSFDKPIIYSKSPIGYFTIADATKILYFAGRFAICDTVDGVKYFDTIGKTWWNGEDKFIIIDSLDINNYIYRLPNLNTSISASEIIEYIPEISNTFLDINNSNLWSNVERKIGNWFVIKHKSVWPKYEEYIFTNQRCSISLSKEEYLTKNIQILNDQSILVEYDNYYLIYGGDKVSYKSDINLHNITEAPLITKTIGGCDITFCDGEENNMSRYEDGTIKIINKKSEIKDTPLELYRRNRYPFTNPIVPKILCTFGGLIFYEEENILKVL